MKGPAPIRHQPKRLRYISLSDNLEILLVCFGNSIGRVLQIAPVSLYIGCQPLIPGTVKAVIPFAAHLGHSRRVLPVMGCPGGGIGKLQRRCTWNVLVILLYPWRNAKSSLVIYKTPMQSSVHAALHSMRTQLSKAVCEPGGLP